MALAIVRATRSSSETDASSTSHTPSGNRSRMVPGHLDRQAGLPCAAGANQGHQPVGRHQGAQLGQLVGPSDKRRERGREIVQGPTTGGDAQGTRRTGEVRMGHLVDTLGPGKVRKVDLAGVDEFDLVRAEDPGPDRRRPRSTPRVLRPPQ